MLVDTGFLNAADKIKNKVLFWALARFSLIWSSVVVLLAGKGRSIIKSYRSLTKLTTAVLPGHPVTT